MLFRIIKHTLFCVVTLLSIAGCSIPKNNQQSNDVSVRLAHEATANPLTPEQAEEILGVAGENYVYGSGLGKTAVNVGTTVLFPPYGIYLLGNAILDYSGYQTYYLTDALPDQGRQGWDNVYEAVTSGPGRVVAVAAGENYIKPDEAKQRLEKVLKKNKLNASKFKSRIDSQARSKASK